MSVTELVYGVARCPVLGYRMMLPNVRYQASVWCYQVKTCTWADAEKISVAPAIFLRACYAMPGTGSSMRLSAIRCPVLTRLANGAALRECYTRCAVPRQRVENSAIGLRKCYAMHGTEPGYDATRMRGASVVAAMLGW
eukprot:902213-Rhodomonas_salina.2